MNKGVPKYVGRRSCFRCESTRDEIAGAFLLAIKKKARTAVGREGKGLLSDPESELRLGREKEKEKREDNRMDAPEKIEIKMCRRYVATIVAIDAAARSRSHPHRCFRFKLEITHPTAAWPIKPFCRRRHGRSRRRCPKRKI